MIDSNWDVNKYKSEHECDEHWELRKKFLLTHKETLPEDELVCMAQVFTNIEFLGCRYPNETMIRIAELAKGVVEEFREKRKDSLKRTFVAASDAASSKVKGGKRSSVGVSGGDMTQSKRPMTFVAASDDISNNYNNSQRRCLVPRDGPLGKFIVIIVPKRGYKQLLDQSVQTNKVPNSRYEVTAIADLVPSFECKYILNGVEFAKQNSTDKKTAKDLCAKQAFEKLREQCYSIVIKERRLGQSVEQSDLCVGETSSAKFSKDSTEKIGSDNVGSKLMKLMGWTGGGLGSKAQGIVEPVAATATVRRAGLGMDPSSTGDYRAFRAVIRKYLINWLNAGAEQDLVFASDFDKEHRKIAHEVARTLQLKSTSYGKDNERQLVISKKISLWSLAEELLQTDGHSDKYDLLDPGSPWDFDE